MCRPNKKCSCNCNLKEQKLLNEKINLALSSLKKRETVKQARIAHDAILSMYELCQKSNVENEFFLKMLDNAYSTINKILTVLVVQNTYEPNNNIPTNKI